VNVVVLKRNMREYAEGAKPRPLKVPRVMWKSKAWGLGARTLAWRVSGHYGKATTDRLKLWEHFHPLSFGQLVARVLAAKVGVHERGYSNAGKWVDIFLHAVYLPGGYAWCAACAIWGQIRAAIINDVMDDTRNDYEVLRDVFHDLCYGNAAYVPNLARAFRERRKAHGWKAIPVTWEEVKAGDIIICFGGGHVETATGPVRAGRVPTVGGNTSETGDQSNGGEVCRKNRAIGSEATSAGRFIPPK
jgi:hypothetical protein